MGAPEVLKIGVSSALSGPGAAWGLAYLQGIQMAADEYNQAGGVVIGDKRYIITLVPYDNKYEAATTALVTEKLLYADKVQLIIAFGSSDTIGMLPITENAGRLVIHWATIKETLVGTEYALKTPLPSISEALAYFNYFKKTFPEKTKVAILAHAAPLGVGMLDDTEVALEQIGGYELVSRETFDPGTMEFYPVITKVLTKDPEIMYLDGTPPGQAYVLIKQIRELGYTGVLAWDAWMSPEEIITGMGADAAEGLYIGNAWDYKSPLAPEPMRRVGENYFARYGEPPGLGQLQGYDNLRLLMEGAKIAGTVDTTPEAQLQIRDAITSMEFIGVWGEYRWGGTTLYGEGNNRGAFYPKLVSQIQGGVSVDLDLADTYVP